MSECIDVLDDLFRQESQGLVENYPRRRIRLPKTAVTLMGGSVLGSEAYGIRHSSVTVLYNTETGKASVLADHLNFPNMAAVGPDGNLYVSTGAICGSTGVAGPPCFGATGSVTRITLAHGEND